MFSVFLQKCDVKVCCSCPRRRGDQWKCAGYRLELFSVVMQKCVPWFLMTCTIAMKFRIVAGFRLIS